MLAHHGTLRKALLCLVGMVCILWSTPSQAQIQGRDRSLLPEFGAEDPMSRLRQRLSAASSAVPIPMEGALDPATYVVGPGDLFDISVGGGVPILVSQPVSADGRLVLPEAGSVMLAGLTLGAARERAIEALTRRFRNVPVEVSLAQPRQFYVHVTGAVPVPGRYLATPVARVSSVLETAFADTSKIPVSNPRYMPSLRTVRVHRQDGTVRTVDLLRYFATGETEHNPYLGDGDVVTVPVYDPTREVVYVDGAVAFPGTYAYRPGDTVRDLLALSGTSETLRTTGQVRVSHLNGDGTMDERLLDLSAALQGSGTDVPVHPRDHVFVMPDPSLKGSATVEGWVHYPGTYPIEPGTTTLRDLLKAAGGLRPDALERAAYLERATLPAAVPARERRQHGFERNPLALNLLRPDTTEILKRMRLTDLDFLSRTYFAQEMRLQNRVSLDLQQVLERPDEPLYLQDGDRLVVPRDEGTVYVFGQVGRPGFVTHAPGREAAHYVASAGGATPMAERAYVVQAGTWRYLPADEAEIRSGDMIFLDRRIALANSPELQRLVLEEQRTQADARIRSTQMVLSIISTAASVVTTYFWVRELLE